MLAAARAGFERILVGGAADTGAGLLTGTPASVVAADAPRLDAARVVLLASNVVPRSDWLRGLLEMPVEPDHLYVDGVAAAVLDARDAGRVVAAATRSRSVAEVVGALRPMFKTFARPLDAEGRFVLASPRDIPAAEAWLLRGLIKASEGFMSRQVERRVSLALTRRLMDTGITPNTMTLISLAIGLLAAPFFLSSTPRYQLTGALLFLAHSILDGCDGELARLKFLESRSGAVLDFWGDNVVHVAVFSCLAIGWSLFAGSPWPLVLGGLTVLGTAAAAAAASSRMTREAAPARGTSPVARVLNTIGHRDFIYLIVVLAAMGKAAWFLAPAAIGAPIFWLLLLWARRAG